MWPDEVHPERVRDRPYDPAATGATRTVPKPEAMEVTDVQTMAEAFTA